MTSQNEVRGNERQNEPTSSFVPCHRGPWSFCAKLSSATMIVFGFFQAIYGDGLGAIEFWLSLFFAAASQQPADDKPAGTAASREEIRYRQIM
jgi:hypothetical protein